MNTTETNVIPHEAVHLPTPYELLELAVTGGAGIETLRELMTLQREHRADQARIAFNAALAAARKEFTPIVKNRRVYFPGKDGKGVTDYRHEDLASVAAMADPILANHGLSYRWETSSEIDKPIIVTCVLFHSMGHEQRNTLSAGRDGTGNKNPVQQMGSTVTYLERYTLKASLGLSVATDDDGRGGGDPVKERPPEGGRPEADSETGEVFITEEQEMELRKMAEAAGANMEKLLAYLKVDNLGQLVSSRYDNVVKTIKRKAAEAKGKK